MGNEKSDLLADVNRQADEEIAKKSEGRFWLAAAFLGAVLMVIGVGLGGMIGKSGARVVEVEVPTPPPKVLEIPTPKLIELLGSPQGTASCDEVLVGAKGGTCRGYTSKDGALIVVASDE